MSYIRHSTVLPRNKKPLTRAPDLDTEGFQDLPIDELKKALREYDLQVRIWENKEGVEYSRYYIFGSRVKDQECLCILYKGDHLRGEGGNSFSKELVKEIVQLHKYHEHIHGWGDISSLQRIAVMAALDEYIKDR